MRWRMWYQCRQCEQKYHGVVRCAMGWACWKTYVNRDCAPSRPGMVSTDKLRGPAMIQLANGLRNGGRAEDALRINIALLDAQRRSGLSPGWIENTQLNIANCYEALGREEEASFSAEIDQWSMLRRRSFERRFYFHTGPSHAPGDLRGLEGS
jgi:hypothetical protein